MLKYLKDKSYSIDFLGPTIGFELNGASNFQSLPGIIYSSVVIVSTLIIGFMFGQEIYLRQNPITSYSIVMNPSSTIWPHDFPFALTFVNGVGATVTNFHEYLTYDAVMYTLDYNATTNRTVFPVELNQCNSTNIKPGYFLDSLNELSGKKFYCYNFNNDVYFANQFATPNSTFLNLRFSKCDSTVKACPADIDVILSNLQIIFTYVNTFVNSQNLTDPIQYFIDTVSIQLSDGLLKRSFVTFINNLFISDIGWLLQDQYYINFISLKDVQTDSLLAPPLGIFYNQLYWLTLNSPQESYITTRSYMKIQDLLANVGGIAYWFYLVVQFATTGHLRFIYLMFLRKCALETKYGSDYVPNLSNMQDSSHIEVSKSNVKILNGNRNLNNIPNKRIIDVNLKSQELNNLDNSNVALNELVERRNVENIVTKNKNEDFNEKLKIETNLSQNNKKQQLNKEMINQIKINEIKKDNSFNSEDQSNDEKIIEKKKNLLENNYFEQPTENQQKRLKKSNTLKKLLFSESKDFSYSKYLLSYISCNSKNIEIYENHLENIGKLVCIDVFSKVMINQFEESKGSGTLLLSY